MLLDQTDVDDKLLKQLSFVQSFSSGRHQVVELSLGRQQGRFNVHVEEFRESGIQHKLLFITDVRTLLRSEERKAWQSLVRVISHEINNPDNLFVPFYSTKKHGSGIGLILCRQIIEAHNGRLSIANRKNFS